MLKLNETLTRVGTLLGIDTKHTRSLLRFAETSSRQSASVAASLSEAFAEITPDVQAFIDDESLTELHKRTARGFFGLDGEAQSLAALTANDAELRTGLQAAQLSAHDCLRQFCEAWLKKL